MSCSTKLSAKPLYISEVDWVNQKVAEACGVPLKFLYQGDGIHPSTRAHQMDLKAFTDLQQENDRPPATVEHICGACKQSRDLPVRRVAYTTSQKMAMSEAWSRELRAKVAESERQREAKKPQICVEIDDYCD